MNYNCYKEEAILTLDDGNKYVVVSDVFLDNEEYLYLVDINNNLNLMFCKLNNNKLKKVTDIETIKKLLEIIGTNN